MNKYQTFSDKDLEPLYDLHDVTIDNVDVIVSEVQFSLVINTEPQNWTRVVIYHDDNQSVSFSYDQEEQAEKYFFNLLTDRELLAFQLKSRLNYELNCPQPY
jgi:hypothetical protein